MTSLRECAVACAFPTNREDFGASLQQRHSEYAKRFAGGWDQYEIIGSILRENIGRYGAAGVTCVEERITAQRLHLLLEEYRIIVLLAHHIVESDGHEFIELWDSRVDPDAFLKLVPADFSGILDFSVCNPSKRFVDVLNRQFQEGTFIYSASPVTPQIWAQLYGDMFKVLSLYPDMAYEDVLVRVVLEHRKQSKSRLVRLARFLNRLLTGKR